MNVFCYIAKLFIFLPLVTIIMMTLYVGYAVLRQRHRQQPWKFLLARGANYAVTMDIWFYPSVLFDWPLKLVRHGMSLIIICGVLFICWFAACYAARLRKTRQESPAPEKAALRAALGDIAFIAIALVFSRVVSKWLFLDNTAHDISFSLVSLPILMLLSTFGKFPLFFSWGKDGTQSVGRAA